MHPPLPLPYRRDHTGPWVWVNALDMHAISAQKSFIGLSMVSARYREVGWLPREIKESHCHQSFTLVAASY